MSETPLLFVCLEGQPPPYAAAALELAVQHAAVPVRVLAPSSFARVVPPGCMHVPLEAFYDPAAASSSLLERGRPRSIERFAVLHRYYAMEMIESSFHAELDGVVFQLDRLAAALRATGRTGMFVPFDRPDRAIGSLIYVEGTRVLHDLLEHGRSSTAGTTDSDVLVHFARSRRDAVTALPTIEVLQDPTRFVDAGLVTLHPARVGFVVDATSLGEGITGVDASGSNPGRSPRGRPRKEHRSVEPHLAATHLVWHGTLPVLRRPGGQQLRVHNLRLREKWHADLLLGGSVECFVERPGSRRRRLLPAVLDRHVRPSGRGR